MKFSQHQTEIMHGLILGDGHLHQKRKTHKPMFTQTFGQNAELFAKHVFEVFTDFCTPKGFYSYKVQSGKNSPFYQRFIVRTTSLEVLQEFVNMYYNVNSLGKRIKLLPLNIENIITPVVLAYFLMSDGNYHKTNHIIRLCTNNFTKQEVELLSTAIYNKYNIQSRVQRARKEQYIIVISKSQVPQLQTLVKPHIIPSMLYRIGL